jgi:VanZ family protein
MVVVYLGLGLVLALSDVFNLGKTMSIIIGVLMMFYGLFRGIRIYRS